MQNKLVAIFKYLDSENKYICDSIAIASIDKENNYRIEVGKYTGYDNNLIKKIVDCDPLNNFNDSKINKVEVIDDNKKFAIFLFDNASISELSEQLDDYTRISAIRFIREKLQRTELINIFDNNYAIKISNKKIIDLPLYDVFSVKNFWQDNKDDFVKKIEIFDIKKENNKNEDKITKKNENVKEEKTTVNIPMPIKIKERDGIDFSAFKFIPADSIENDEIYKELNEMEKYSNKIDPVEIIKSISKHIVGQEEAIKTIVSNIYFNQKLIDSLDCTQNNEINGRKVSILLDGPTGTGKSQIFKEIKEKLPIPVVVSNINLYSEVGYVGSSVTDILKDLINAAEGNLELAERGIIVLDEVDKIACNPSSNGKDSKKVIQEELLGLISGGKFVVEMGKGPLSNNSKEIDTSKITFILSGAFTSLREKKIKENNSSSIGFNTREENRENVYIIDDEDYIEYGLLREFFGRIKVIANTKGYTKEDLKKILLESEISPLKNFDKNVNLLENNKIKNIIYDDEFIDRLCEEAYNKNTGARALESIVSSIQNMYIQDIITNDFTEDEIVLDSSLLDSYTKKKVRRY